MKAQITLLVFLLLATVGDADAQNKIPVKKILQKNLHKSDSVIFIGRLLANDPTDIMRLGKTPYLSVSALELSLNWKDQSVSVITDEDGCFEVKLPPSIIESSVVLAFQNDYFQNYTFVFSQNKEKLNAGMIPVRSNVNLVNSSETKYHPPSLNEMNYVSSRPLRIAGNPWVYDFVEIERRGIDNIFKDFYFLRK